MLLPLPFDRLFKWEERENESLEPIDRHFRESELLLNLLQPSWLLGHRLSPERLGALTDTLINTSLESTADIAKLKYTPAGAFGSCRYQLKANSDDYQRLLNVFKKHNIAYFFYNGGGDSMDTAHKISQFSQQFAYPITCIGIPKTIDNDLPFTDNSPGFGSVAKYIAISTKEAGFDVASMAATSTKVFILEVMGRHTGWIAAASALANEEPHHPPHIICLPEVAFMQEKFLNKVDSIIKQHGYCVIVVAEGIQNTQGQFLSESGLEDSFGHKQLGGVAPVIARLIQDKLGYKYHWAVADYLQRSARHIAAQVDVDQAYALGKYAVELAIAGHNDIMPIITRTQNTPYQWGMNHVNLSLVANQEKKMPAEFIATDGFGVTAACLDYLRPLIQGEAYPLYKNGMPDYVRLKNFTE